ncbi:hypothetical protein PFISCL1PPCAC_4777, partial [Pristionchus fissidentatus]
MEITFKTLSQDTFKLRVDPTDKISDVKEKIADVRGDAAELQKLIYNGRVLPDDKTAADCGLDAAKFVVVMVSKPPQPAAAAAAAPEADAPIAEPEALEDPVVLTAEQENAVQAIMGMGFPREESIVALEAANFNPDVAFNFLLGGAGGGGRRGGR